VTARPAVAPQAPAHDAARSPLPAQAGVGLRFPHQRLVAETRPEIPWFEVHTENYFGGGTRLRILESIRETYPLSLHGTALSPGSAEGIDRTHLARVAEAIARLEPAVISEHLSFSTVDGTYLADLLPLPLTEEALGLVCHNVEQVQDALKRRILMENPSTYLRFRHSTIPEWEFLAAVAARTGCGILCDVNNVYVSACNHGWNASEYLAALPGEAIGEYHLAGHARCVIDGATVLIDNHGSRVAEPVWALFDEALARFGPKPTLIEWDTDIPDFSVLQEEGARAERALRNAAERHACAA
jgi:uncharacterized protein (UPF0276 family)